MTTETRFRANSLTSNGSSRPSTPNGSILYDLLTQKETRKTTKIMKIAVLANTQGYTDCMITLQRSINFILEQPELQMLEDRLKVIEQNWLWVMLIDLAMSNIELHFGEVMITANQNEDLSYNNYPTKEIARMLASCLNSIRNQYHPDFTDQDINLLKKVCLLQSSDVPDSILSDLAKSKFQLNFGQILLAISNLQKVDKGHLINLLFGSQTRPIGLILKSLRR